MQRSQIHLYTLLLFAFLCLSATSAIAQNFSGHNWYFGNSSSPGLGIRFNRGNNSAALVTDKTFPFGTGGSAVASDPINGNLLFYTDGSTIFDASHQIMPNGTALGANTTSNQPVVIAKAPGPGKRYFVFVNTANFTTGGTVSFRVVDMNAFGNALFPSPALGAGETPGNTAVPGLTARSEAMIVIPHSNGEDFWLVTHANGTPDFSVTAFTAAGPGTTLLFNGLGLIDVAANFSYHAATGKIAVSPQEDTRDIEIFDFDDATGTISNPQRVLNTGLTSTTNQTIYDTEWSNSGRYLYYSVHGETGIQADVFQYDTQNPLNSIATVLPAAISRSYGLQMAPDSAIYHLYQATAGGPFLVGTLTNTDTTANAVIYTPTVFGAATDFNGTQFPAFAPQDTVLLSVDFTSRGTCSNAPTAFFPTVNPTADSLVWDFGDGTGANAWSPVHTYDAGGTFNVKLTAFLNGDTASVTHPVNITQFDLTLDLVQDTTACACELPVNNGEPLVNGGNCPDDTADDFSVDVTANGGSPTFQWFGPGGLLPGQNSATLKPDSAGYYYVVATIGSCSAYAGINIKEYDSLDQRANIWYFGQNAGIDFNGLPDDPAVAIDGPLNTPEGTSVISDRNGQVIFSTDGQRIYDKTDTEIPIPVPPGLGGEPGATQSALIMPVAGDETLFYIFTTQEVYGSGTYEVRYSLFDLKLNNGLGGLQEINQLLFRRSTERLTGNANWLIAHEYGNNSFRAYQVGPNGIGSPVISAIGSDHSTSIDENGQGYMELGAQNRLAVALSNPGTSNAVEIFDFVDSSGVVTNFRRAELTNTTGQVYGIEVSPSGNKLFATVRDAVNSEIHELAFDTLGMPYFVQSVSHAGELGAMQRGPDGQVYVAINGSTSLGTFQINEDTTANSTIDILAQPFNLVTGTTSQLGLPNFIQILNNPVSTPSMSFNGICFGDSTQFNGSGKDPAIDKFDWTFGDGSSLADGGAQVNHLYSAPGTYTVTLRVYNKCEPAGYATFTEDVIIVAPPADPSQGVTLCTGSLTLDANPLAVPNYSYAWSTGDTTRTLVIDQQAIYDVTISDANGCTTDASFLAADNRPQVDFGPNLTLCQNTPVAPLNAQNPGLTFVWTLNDVPNGNTIQTQGVNTSLPGTFEYEVLVTDPITTCFREDSIIYTINESPAFTAVPTNPLSCGQLTGTINLTITAPAASLFTYFITGPTSSSNIDQTVSPPSILATGLGAGTYGVTVSDQVSGCATITTVAVNDPAFTVTGTQQGTCDPIFINATIAPTPGPLPNNNSTYRVIDVSTNAVVQNTTATATLNFATTTALPSNNEQYIVEVTNNGCVASSAPIDIDEAPAVQATLSADPCVNPIQITATPTTAGAGGFAWAGPNITAGANASTVSATPPQGNNTYTVTITQAGLCALDTTITVNVNNDVLADFTQTDPCADQVTLSATPAGNYTYRWLQNNAAVLGGQTLVVTTAADNAMFQVQVVNALTGCTFDSPAKQVNVEGDLQITLASTPPCEGTPFTLTAGSNLTPVTFSWTVDGAPIAGQTGATLVRETGGLYEVTVTRGVCAEKVPFNVVVNPTTAGLLTDTGIICPEAPDLEENRVILDAGPGFLLYQWYRNGSQLNGETNQTYEATDVGTYRVELLNVYQCESSDETILVEECDPRITGPNAFRPGSGVNEGGEFTNREFKLFTFFIDDESFEVFIFNRWGEMIFSSTDRNFRWNGGYNNNLSRPLPPGTYSYVVKYKSSYRPEEGIREKRGGVVLLR
jgi:large repetitive protein